MPRSSKIFYPDPKEWFPCPFHGCHRKFRSHPGRTKHIRANHKTPAPDTCLPPINLDSDQDIPRSSLHQDVQLEVASDLSNDDHHPSSPLPFQPEVASDLPNNNHHPSSPLLFQAEVAYDLSNDNHHPSSPPPFQPDVAYNLSNDDHPSSPPPFQPEVAYDLPNNNQHPSSPSFQREVEIHHDQAEQVNESTTYHPFLNGMTYNFFLLLGVDVHSSTMQRGWNTTNTP